MQLSTHTREQRLHAAVSKVWDVIVIGGGITGAGIALDAAHRGMSCALFEMQDFAAGTSSRSTKLIHGGLRYLKQLHVKMVAEVGREREIVYENGPHVTTPERMLLPMYQRVGYGKLATSFAVSVYDLLAGVRSSERKETFTAEETLNMVPSLRKEGLQGSVRYVEYRTDDARLTLEVLKKAAELGACPVNYAKVERFLHEGDAIAGVVVVDQLTGDRYEVRGTAVINATGPWSDDLRKTESEVVRLADGKKLMVTKGVHIVIDSRRLPLTQAIYFDMPDGRMIFAVPREGKIYVGTTDTVYDGDMADPHMDEEDMNYLLSAVHYIFPEAGIDRADVESSWAGLRPLIYEEGKSPSQVSRKDEIWESPSGLLTIAGGKLTGYRKMAEHIVDRAAKQLERRTGRLFPGSGTKTVPVSGGDVGGSAGFEAFVRDRQIRLIRASASGTLDERSAERLVRLYGSNIDAIIEGLPRYNHHADKHGVSLFTAITVLYGIEHEMAATPSDYFLRRLPLLLFDIDAYHREKEGVLRFMSAALGWDEAVAASHREALERHAAQAMGNI